MPNAPEAREGDVNLSPNRAAWRASLGEATRAALDEDERWFLHQSLSTPCLDEIVAAEGATLIDHEGRRILDFHGNSVHQVGYGHPRVVAAVKGALDTLRRIKAMGVGVAMDDFGTGFSSLSTLQSFPFDKIKIDKSFVQGIGQFDRSTVIVRAVLGIGRGLGIPVVAEGVETQAQLDFLKQEDCAAIQGYLLGRPAPLEDHRALFNAVTWGTAPAIHTLAPLTNLLDRAVS